MKFFECLESSFKCLKSSASCLCHDVAHVSQPATVLTSLHFIYCELSIILHLFLKPLLDDIFYKVQGAKKKQQQQQQKQKQKQPELLYRR